MSVCLVSRLSPHTETNECVASMELPLGRPRAGVLELNTVPMYLNLMNGLVTVG